MRRWPRVVGRPVGRDGGGWILARVAGSSDRGLDPVKIIERDAFMLDHGVGLGT
jgi:hypothetical protein